jgi:hypothetical protein
MKAAPTHEPESERSGSSVPGNCVFDISQGTRKLAPQSFRVEGETFRLESTSNECDPGDGF